MYRGGCWGGLFHGNASKQAESACLEYRGIGLEKIAACLPGIRDAALLFLLACERKPLFAVRCQIHAVDGHFRRSVASQYYQQLFTFVVCLICGLRAYASTLSALETSRASARV